MLTTLAIGNYRSLRDLVVPLSRLNVVTGANGSGKSSLYRAFRLLAEASRGRLVSALAREGGLPSTLWAGPETVSRDMKAGRVPVQGGRRQGPVRLRLGFGREDFGFAIELGMPTRSSSAFALDPEIKRECIWHGPVCRRASVMIDRRGPVLRGCDEDGTMIVLSEGLSPFASAFTEFADPKRAPELGLVRDSIASWRFYDHLRTDADAPSRRPQVGTYTPVLAPDGGDVAAALQTIREIGDGDGLDRAIDDAFPGSRVVVDTGAGRFAFGMRQPGMLRSLASDELSDGTLRYVLLVAALLTPRPPELLVLNEPETSLHADLIAPLARLIGGAAERSQVIVVSHDAALIAALAREDETNAIRLDKVLGETVVADRGALDRPAWRWPQE